MLAVARHVGRLCEAVFRPPFTLDEANALAADVRALITSIAPRPSLFLCDLRPVTIFPPEIAERLVALMKSDNPLVERNGMLISAGSVFGLQMERMLREAGNPARRTFRDPLSLLAWLDETFTPEERARAREFVGVK